MSVQKDLILDFDNFLLDIQSCNLNNRRDFYEKNTVLQQKLALLWIIIYFCIAELKNN